MFRRIKGFFSIDIFLGLICIISGIYIMIDGKLRGVLVLGNEKYLIGVICIALGVFFILHKNGKK